MWNILMQQNEQVKFRSMLLATGERMAVVELIIKEV